MKYRFKPMLDYRGHSVRTKIQVTRDAALLQLGIAMGKYGDDITYAAVHRIDETGNDCGPAVTFIYREPVSAG